MIENKNILAITLARGGSSRIPRKNIIDINGKPLLQYTIDEVKKSQLIDKYFVSTEDKEIKNICKNLNVEVWDRDILLAQNTTTSYEALYELVLQYRHYDYVVEIMCTNPLKIAKDIDNCIELLYSKECDSVVSVVQVYDYHPSRLKYIGSDGELKDFYPEIPESRRQDLKPPAYVRNGSIYATTVKSFLKYKRRCGPDTRVYVMPEKRTINIDEPDDLELAKIKLKNKS